jgi:hypothetical protein
VLPGLLRRLADSNLRSVTLTDALK